MPSTDSAIRIIPFYAQPHVFTKIIDHTQYEETVATPPDTDNLPFAVAVVTGADSGIDNTFVRVNDKTVKDAIFGKANFAKYGQPSLQADVLFNGQTSVWFCRVLPDNATYANLITMINFRKGKVLDSLGQETGLHRLEVKFSVGYANKPYVTEGAKSEQVIYQTARSMAKATEDPQTGYMALPLFHARATGRGKYGNKYSMSLTRDTDYENDYGMKIYAFNLIENGTITRAINCFRGSLLQTTRYDMSTLISDVLDEFSTGSCPVSITSYEDTIEALFAFYQQIVAENRAYLDDSGCEDEQMLADQKYAESIVIDTFDPIFGLRQNTQTDEKIPYYQNYTKRDEEWAVPDLEIPADEGRVKPADLSEWDTCSVGAKVLVAADPDNDSQRWLYTVAAIDQETGRIIYDEGEPVDLDADQFTGINISQDVGHMFAGGHDGDFQEITVNGKTRAPNAAEMKLLLSREYVRAFRGEKDRKILSPARVNLDFIFDANYNMTTDDSLEITGPTDVFANNTVLTDADNQIITVLGGSTINVNFSDLNVKKAIYDLNEFRNRNGMTINPDQGAGCSIYLDCNLVGLKSLKVSIELKKILDRFNDLKIYGWGCSVDLGYCEIFDPITGKRIQVTATYLIAKNLVNHIVQYGINKPFAKKHARFTSLQRTSSLSTSGTIIRDSFRPDIDLIDWDVKEYLYKSRINYWVSKNEGRTVQRDTQSTRQLEASALLEENNVRVLNTLKKGLEAACDDYLYDWNDPVARKGYTTAQMDIYRPWIGTVVEDLDIVFKADEFEQERMMMHCYCDVKFRDIVKRIILEININRPQYTLES